ncbi:hypothetical protein PTQ27_08545 [Mannheimia sp. AT1]|uniref:Lipoprotein n=1 Tax=Mannheimia cairinae TaxID=3025936 RepID=A0ABT5MSS5_9PAST|nr:hypothetical protein [Mannheimia cairinae]MDD0824511.1 hypothetical protein [Mannheimia cairinae]MDD0825612.1 hypothetical protein [Mannheimia cairinae]
MKKILVVSTVALLSACNSFIDSNDNEIITPTSQHFVGEWACTMNGVAGTSNKVKLTEKGGVTYLGNMILPAENPLFNYTLERSGSWAFADNTLTYTFTKGKVSRSHSEEVLENLKTDKEKNSLEKQYFDALRQQVNQSSTTNINLAVSNFTKKAFNIEQKVSGNVRTGSCVNTL